MNHDDAAAPATLAHQQLVREFAESDWSDAPLAARMLSEPIAVRLYRVRDIVAEDFDVFFGNIGCHAGDE
jgi:hypothetical protein